MSIEDRQKNTSALIADLEPLIGSFSLNLSNSFQNQEKVHISANIPELSCALAHIQNISSHIIVIISKNDLPNAHLFNKMGELFNSERTWHIISDKLSDQELSGEVITDHSRAYHALYGTEPAGFVVLQEALRGEIPNPEEYIDKGITIPVGDQIAISDMVTTLTDAGFVRHRTSLEEGSFQVRGESIGIWHPSWTHTITLTFSGNVVESITKHNDRRSEKISRVRIPPLAFPTNTSSWSDISQECFVFRPGAVSLPAASTGITDSPDPELVFPPTVVGLATALARHISPTQPSASGRPLTYEQALEVIGALEVGKPAVHVDHGIGIFEGLQRRTLEEYEKEYLVIRYDQGDAVSVPVEFAHKITPYVGQATPVIHRLHGTAWQKTRKAAKEDALAFAKELLAIAGKRSDASRGRYHIDDAVDKELDDSFAYELTPDQQRTWGEIREDMQKEIPMDRLVIGDVGFGKTEVAYRAARHAVANGKQVAVLAPTTLLVQQHFDVFSKRLPKEAGTVFLLSRFTTPAQYREAVAAITNGTANIVVGTHALLSPKLVWNNLGLVVVDEEQRFGVKQKEQFKKVRAGADVLSLSATPIPRTLSMALSGLRSLSLISTPPQGRKQVETNVGYLTEEKLAKAIQKELDRDGQVYIVAPKIRQLAGIKHQVRELFPNVPLEVAHGQLSDDVLADTIHRFDSGETKILISSSIVEHGLDLPTANTMIVFHAPHFGLADLYQLRGRIGRRSRQGYAHFFYTQHKLTTVQRQRLTALTESARLGSGWELARRDLEIRGAGNLLGAEQSGSVNAVGVQLYLDMVRQATSDETAEQADIVLPFTSLLPPTYIQDTDERTSWYVRLTRAKTLGVLEKKSIELQQRFGEFPPEVANLIRILALQRVATSAGIQKIHTEKVTPVDDEPYDRLVIETAKAPEVLQKVSALGNWRVRGSALTWDTNEITQDTITTLTGLLSQ